jgi:hypothetical protein
LPDVIARETSDLIVIAGHVIDDVTAAPMESPVAGGAATRPRGRKNGTNDMGVTFFP